jgi:4-hydroxybenzoate polyprenyltransferase
MNKTTAVFRLIRFPYLITGIFIMFVTRLFIIKPILAINDFSLQFSDFNFGILVFALSSLIAAGYIINDYFDSKADRNNKRKGTVIGRKMSRLTAISLHTILNLFAVLAAAWVSESIGMLRLAILFVMASGLLWFYSTSYKHKKILGKLVLSTMIAALPLVITLYEIPDLNREYGKILLESGTNFKYLFNWTGGFAVFLFLVSIIRLIIKEKIESVDKSCDIYITIGERVVLYLLYFVLISFFVALRVFIFNKDMITTWYFSILIIVPIFLSMTQIRELTTYKNLKLSDLLIKVISIAGILYTVVINYLFYNNLI